MGSFARQTQASSGPRWRECSASSTEQAAAVVLHFGGDPGATLRHELGPPVECATAAGSFAVKLVQGFDGEELVVAADVVLDHGVELGANYEVQRLLI